MICCPKIFSRNKTNYDTYVYRCACVLGYSTVRMCVCIPYTAKLSRGKTFAVVHKIHHSLENFRGASGPCHYVLYTANDSRGKLSRLATKPQKPRKFSPLKVLPYTVFAYVYVHSVIYYSYIASAVFQLDSHSLSTWSCSILY